MFKKNKILSNSEILAGQLRTAREQKKLKLKYVSEKLNINYRHLKTMEKGDFEKLPPGTYGKSFIKEYSNFLDLDSDNSIKIFNKIINKNQPNENQNLKRGEKNELFSKQVVKSYNFINIPKIAKGIIITMVVLICFVYLGIYLKNIISPPDIQIIEPIENLVTDKNFVNIIGLTEPEAEITINGENIFNDSKGVFTKRINLKNGINTITITAKKKYSRENTIKRQILVNNNFSE